MQTFRHFFAKLNAILSIHDPISVRYLSFYPSIYFDDLAFEAAGDLVLSKWFDILRL